MSSKISLTSRLQNQEGVSLVVVLGLTIVLLALAAGAIKLVLSFMRTTTQVEQGNIAYLAAEAGVEMALYDLSAYQDGYQTDPKQSVCGSSVDISATDKFSGFCADTTSYRFVNFTKEDKLSQGRGFWRLFSRTLKDQDSANYVIPNPYFVGNKDGRLVANERGLLTKSQPFGLSLLIDNGDLGSTKISDRFDWVEKDKVQRLVLDPGPDFDDSKGADNKEALLIWTLSAVDTAGEEHTLQGVVNEQDFKSDCGRFSTTDNCFILDLNTDLPSPNFSGDNPLVGEDINRNIPSSRDSNANATDYNRVSGVNEIFPWNTPKGFITDLNSSLDGAANINDWSKAWLSVSLIGSLSETSGVASNALSYDFLSQQPWADEFTYIVSEGYAGTVKQTIETRFRRGSAIPIFSYVIFQ